MVYANDQWVQLPTKDLYDSQIMAIAINAAKDMYEKGQEEIKDFNKLYGDFYTPIIGDQSKYDQEVMQPVRNVINAIYAAGGDPLRSPEARGLINKAIYNIDTAKVALLRQRADLAKEYYKNLGALKAKGLYSEDFSKGFLKEDPQQWAEDYIGSTSPTELQTLKQATESFYNNRTAHILDKAGVESFGIPYDPRYSYTGFTDKDIMDIAAKNAPGFSGTPIADYYRYLAEKKVAASGLPYTQADVENQFQKDIAQANVEWKIAPQRTADQFAVTNQQFKNSLALQKNSQEFEREKARQAAKDKLDQIRARYGNRPGGTGTIGENYSLTEAIHHDLLYQGLRNNGIQIPQLTKDKNGNLVPVKKNGKIQYKNPDDATYEELEYAANKGNYIYNIQQYFKGFSEKYKDDPEKIVQEIKKKLGGKITGVQLAGVLKRQIQKDGSILISDDERKLIRGPKGLAGDIIGSSYKDNKISRVGETAPSDRTGLAEIHFNINDISSVNAVQFPEKYNKGRTEVYVNGTITYVKKDKDGHVSHETVNDVWMPIGINSENVYNSVPNLSLNGSKQSAYSSIDANYLKQLGQQQKANFGLFANSQSWGDLQMPSMIDPDDYLDYLLDQQ